MAKKASFESLTKTELEIMNILWDAPGPMTTTAIREQSKKWSTNAYLFRVVRSLMEKGFVKDIGEILVKSKKTRIITPIVTREEYQGYFFDTFCDSSMQSLLSGIIKTRDDKTDVIDELKAWLDAQDQED